MIRDFLFLWRFREKSSSPRRWFVIWGKRVRHSAGILRLLVAPSLLRARGGTVGRLVFLGTSRLEGNRANFSIGDESSLGRCHIVLHDRVTIGRRVAVNDGVEILTASHSLGDPCWQTKKAPVALGDYSWIATNAIIMPGVTVGVGAVVGAGAVVRSNVGDHEVVIGNPAQPVDVRRATTLSYSPVVLNAPLEAWVGPGFHTDGPESADI